MRQSRYWLGLLVTWLSLVAFIPALVESAQTLSHMMSAVVCIVALFIGLPRSVRTYIGLAIVVVGVRPWLGYSTSGTGLVVACCDVLAVIISLELVTRVTSVFDRLQVVAEDAVTIQLGGNEITPLAGERQIGDEMARSRQFERPLTVMTLSARGHRGQQQLNELLKKAQREVIDRYVEGRLYRLLRQHLRDSDIVTRQNGQLVVMMPESDRQFALDTISRVQEQAADELGLTVQAGIAAFPSEERTLVGLLDRATAEMESKLLVPAHRDKDLDGHRPVSDADLESA